MTSQLLTQTLRHGAKTALTDDELILSRVNESVAFLQRELDAGRVIYGVNTGFGGSADTRTQHFKRLQSALVQHLNVGILLSADKGIGMGRKSGELLRSHALPPAVVRATMLVRCNSLMRGHSGVRISVIESVMKLLSHDMTPVIPLRGSISASGDLSTLSYIAGTLEGNPDVFVRTVNNGEENIIRAPEALSLAGITPVRLQAKEGLGITNGTAASCAMASIVMHQANRLALLTQLLTAMGTEALAGTAHNYHPFISAIRPHSGQAEAASNILKFLSGSKLSPDRDPGRIGLAQDRYALRTAPQWIGPQLEDLMLATRQVQTELNSTTDNPLIDAVDGHIHHGGNFQAMAITSAMDKTMTALQNLGRLIFSQSNELINNMTNRGLPPNLSADEPSGSFTFKGFDVNMAAYMAELSYLARPMSAHVQAAEMTNQSVNSMALAAARYALEAVEVLSLMAATYLLTLCQALNLRVLLREFHSGVTKRLEAGQGFYFSLFLREGYDSAFPAEAETKFRQLMAKSANALLQRWDQSSHMDLRDRCKVATREWAGVLAEGMDDIPELEVSSSRLIKEQCALAIWIEDKYNQLRSSSVKSTAEYLSPFSRAAYEFARQDLHVPLNRGVEDHPPLLFERVGRATGAKPTTNGNGTNWHVPNGVKTEQRTVELEAESPGYQVPLETTQPCVPEAVGLEGRARILGTMASEIYEAIRSGELHDRIMQFAEENKIWEE